MPETHGADAPSQRDELDMTAFEPSLSGPIFGVAFGVVGCRDVIAAEFLRQRPDIGIGRHLLKIVLVRTEHGHPAV